MGKIGDPDWHFEYTFVSEKMSPYRRTGDVLLKYVVYRLTSLYKFLFLNVFSCFFEWAKYRVNYYSKLSKLNYWNNIFLSRKYLEQEYTQRPKKSTENSNIKQKPKFDTKSWKEQKLQLRIENLQHRLSVIESEAEKIRATLKKLKVDSKTHETDKTSEQPIPNISQPKPKFKTESIVNSVTSVNPV